MDECPFTLDKNPLQSSITDAVEPGPAGGELPNIVHVDDSSFGEG